MKLSISVKSWSHWSSGKIFHGCSLRPYPGGSSKNISLMSCRLAFSEPWEDTFLCTGPEGFHLPPVQIPRIWLFLPSSVLPQVTRRICLWNVVQHREKSPGQALSPTQLFSAQLWGCILQAGILCLLRCSEISVQMTGTRWDGEQRESRTGGTGKWLKWTISESKVHQIFTIGVHMQVWQNYPSSTGALIFLHPSLVSIMGSTSETSLFIAYCQVSLWHAVKKTTPHLSELKQGDAWENKWSLVGSTSLDGVMDRVRAVRRKCSDHKHTLPVTSTKRHLLTWTGMLLAVQTLKAIQSWWTFSKPLSWAQDASSEDFPIPMLSWILNNSMDYGISAPLSETPGVDHKWWQEKGQG